MKIKIIANDVLMGEQMKMEVKFMNARELWPINRITGEGVRETLKKISHHLPTLDINLYLVAPSL